MLSKRSIHHSAALMLLGSLGSGALTAPLPEELPPINAFSAGTGYSAVAYADDPATVYWNPAGLAVCDLMEVDLTVAASKFESPGSWSFLTANGSQKGDSRFGLAILRRSAERDGVAFHSFQIGVPFSYSISGGTLPVGFTVKFISEQWDESRWSYGMALDLGAMLRWDQLAFGVATQNLTASDLRAFRRDSYVGTSWGGDDEFLMIAGKTRLLDGFGTGTIRRDYNLGVQLTTAGYLPQLRAGRMVSEGRKWITLGAGYSYARDNVELSYALIFDPDTHGSRVHTLTYSFGIPPGPGKKR